MEENEKLLKGIATVILVVLTMVGIFFNMPKFVEAVKERPEMDINTSIGSENERPSIIDDIESGSSQDE